MNTPVLVSCPGRTPVALFAVHRLWFRSPHHQPFGVHLVFPLRPSQTADPQRSQLQGPPWQLITAVVLRFSPFFLFSFRTLPPVRI